MMPNCCEEHKKKAKVEDNPKKFQSEKPKSVIGKYLYNLGKKEAEKEAKEPNEGCC
jgi:hypothetical protein